MPVPNDRAPPRNGRPRLYVATAARWRCEHQKQGQQRTRMNDQQETLVSLAADTGVLPLFHL